MSRAHTISMREKHITRKKRICRDVYKCEYYKNDGQYNKGKIHCSCPICSAKTNDKNLVKSRGPIHSSHSSRLATTHNRRGRKNWTVSDMRRLDELQDKLEEYNEDDI